MRQSVRTIKLGKMYHFNSLASIYMTWIIKDRTSKKELLYPKTSNPNDYNHK